MIALSLGSNIDDRRLNLKKAIDKLKISGFDIIGISSIYETEPVGYKDQNDFINIVLTGEYNSSPFELLSKIHKIESELGRERKFKDSPRTIDIDIIAFNDINIRTEELTIPHKEWKNRNFVLYPLKEIAPELVIDSITVKDAAAVCSDNSEVVKLEVIQDK